MDIRKTTSHLWAAFMMILGVAAFAPQANAVPIAYSGQLLNNTPVVGTNNQPVSNEDNPIGANYYYFYANAGSNVIVDGDRLDGPFDMSFWIFSGLYSDTNDFGATFPGLAAANFIDFGDDDTAPNLPGPFGDPLSNFIAPVTGFYTVAVTNFLSSEPGPYDFRLTANGVVPEPASLALFGLALAGLGAFRRRQR